MRKEIKLTLAVAATLSVFDVAGVRAHDTESGGFLMTHAEVSTGSPAPQSTNAATRTIEGTVVDKTTGEPLIGATIQVKGQPTSGTVTDVDGHFKLSYKTQKKDVILMVSYVGYQPKEVPVEGVTDLKIELDASAQSLNEVVVTGTGVQKKVSVTGAISSVSGAELKTSASTLTQNLAGKFAGVYANNTSGEPGSGAEFYIRGISNFAGKSATPLILLDDVEISAGDLNYIPAENIKSFSVLKDASATAIYGARGANGVMIITTKGGDYNTKTKINVTLENSFNFMGKLPEFADGATYMEMWNKASLYRNPNEPLKYTDEMIERTRSGINPYLYPDVDWQNVLFKKMAMRQRGNVNVSGGGSKVKYYMSLEFLHETGHYKTEKLYSWNNQLQNYNYTFQNNISYKLTPTTTISMNMNAQIHQNTRPNVNADNFFASVMDMTPVEFPTTFPAREGIDHVMFGCYDKGGGNFSDNPYAQLRTSFRQENSNTVNTVIKLNQDLDMITKGLNFNVWVNFKSWSWSGYTRSVEPYLYYINSSHQATEDWQDTMFMPLRAGTSGSKYISQSDISKASDNTFELQANLNWLRSFGEHELNAVAIYRMREYRNKVLPNRNQGISGRVTYDYGHKYLAEFNFGYNGTERLAKGYRFGFFPAGSIGWVISNENFWAPISPVVSYFKVRGSYGLVGSDDMTPVGSNLYFFYYDQIYQNNLSALGFQTGAGASLGVSESFGGPQMIYYGLTNLGWEKVKKFDVGVDIRLFEDLNITLDYFCDKRYDILMARQSWPSSLGYGAATPYGPVGRITNKGVEGSVTYSKALTSDLSVSFNGNFTYNKNVLVEGDELQYKYPWLYSTNLPLNYMRGYVAEGLFQSEEEIANSPTQDLGSRVMVGDIKYRDLNGDGRIDTDDQTMLSSYGTTPRLQYGFGATVNWKRWDFGFFFTGSAKRKIMINKMQPFSAHGWGGSPRNVMQWVVDNHFDPELNNFDAEFPRMGLGTNDFANNNEPSSFWLRNGDFLRLRNLELGYSFPICRIYVQGINLVNFTSFKYWDPEMGSWNKYPTQSSVTIGAQFNL